MQARIVMKPGYIRPRVPLSSVDNTDTAAVVEDYAEKLQEDVSCGRRAHTDGIVHELKRLNS